MYYIVKVSRAADSDGELSVTAYSTRDEVLTSVRVLKKEGTWDILLFEGQNIPFSRDGLRLKFSNGVACLEEPTDEGDFVTAWRAPSDAG